jgi:GDPmannose 4,6-dehydratase
MKKLKALIFGISGQDGFYLSSLLEKKGIEIIGSSRTQGIKGDVGDLFFVESLIKEHTPDYIFHLAADSSTNHQHLFQNHNSISTGTINILEICRMHSPESRIFLAGSAMQFKNDGSPISESTPFSAGSPYALARIQSTYAGRYYRDSFGMKVYVGFLFNHDSPLRSESHINQKIVKTAQRIKAGEKIKLEIGSVEVRKEFNFAGDIVEAIWTLVNQNQITECVIGSGISYSIREWIESCFSIAELEWRDHVILLDRFIPEYQNLVSSPGLIRSIGWDPRISFESLAQKMMRVNI